MRLFVFILFTLFLFSCGREMPVKFEIAGHHQNSPLYIDQSADSLIYWAACELAGDIGTLTGVRPKVLRINPDESQQELRGIIIGPYNDKLLKQLYPESADSLEAKWEKYIIRKHGKCLFLIGSDIRGTVYAVFDLAEQLGVSPWKWWADVKPDRKEELIITLPNGGITASPSVQYRGIFLNDEDWGLHPWASRIFEPETGDIGPKTYEKIFQLLLRLKANTLWPAMHPCTGAFYRIPGNKEMAQKYHIVIGTSHAEPMLRNNVDEWDRETRGEYNYFTNSKAVDEYWRERIEDLTNPVNQFIVTLGMRGLHDSQMEGNATMDERVTLLDTILTRQRKMLTGILKRPVEDIPQVLIPYKEVLELYNAGLEVPEDVTLMWTDDNYGYIRRLSNEEEQKRKGGSGIYYHISYWGRPHDYLWLSTTQPGLIWYEMTKAWQNGAGKIWIVNVGDIKPAEYTMEFFLDLAWNIRMSDENTIGNHLHAWAAREFGSEYSDAIAEVMNEYYRLAFLRKPEYMGWSQTEPITAVQPTEFSIPGNGHELQRRIDNYAQLVKKTVQIKKQLPEEKYDTWFQLVEYPVRGAALMNFKFLYAQLAWYSEDSTLKKKYAELSENAYNEIVSLTHYYNDEMSGGKWKYMLSMAPRNLPAYRMPEYYLVPHGKIITGEKDTVNGSPQFIRASDYRAARGSGAYTWGAVKGLGYSNSAITLFPFRYSKFVNDQPSVTYNFTVDQPGNYLVEVRCLPTHSNSFDNKLILRVDGSPQESFALNTRGRSPEWKENVLRNAKAVCYPVTLKAIGNHTLTLEVNQTGIVIDQIAVYPADYGPFYEFRN